MIKKLKPLEGKRKPKPEQDAFKHAERVREVLTKNKATNCNKCNLA